MVEFVGYHGTNNLDLALIKANGFTFNRTDFLSQSHRVPNDLGQGVYFFIEGHEKAYDLALKYVKSFKGEILQKRKAKACVVKVEICHENDDEHLDCDLHYNIKYLSNFRYQLRYKIERQYAHRARSDGAKNRGNLDGYVFETLINYLEKKQNIKIKTVSKSTYTPFDNTFKLSNIPNGTELCVRDVSCISILEEV